jgi:type VI protein secretion system component Hcp
LCANETLTEVRVTLLKATGTSGEQKAFLTFTFTNACINSFHWSGGTDGDDSPNESISICFCKFDIEYSKQDTETGEMKPSGNSSWDLTRMSK